jgi:hypothetical protein
MSQVPDAVVPVDAAGPCAGVSVCYPPLCHAGGPLQAIAARGNLPLLIGDCVLAEVSSAQLDCEWRASEALSDAQAADYCRRAAARLSRAFDSGLGAADLTDVVANAAVLFVISLRKAGVGSPRDIVPCTVHHDGSGCAGRVSAAG